MNLIKRFYINNLYSFNNFEVDFTNKNAEPFSEFVLMGKNNVGKTNLIKTIKEFSELIKEIESENLNSFGFDKVFDENNEFIEYEIELQNQKYNYKYFLRINWKTKTIIEEELYFKLLNAKAKYKKYFKKTSEELSIISDNSLLNKDTKRNISRLNKENKFKNKLILIVLKNSLEEIPNQFYELVTNFEIILEGRLLKSVAFFDRDYIDSRVMEIFKKNKKQLLEIIIDFDLSLTDFKVEKLPKKESEILESEYEKINSIIGKVIDSKANSNKQKQNEKEQEQLRKAFDLIQNVTKKDKFIIKTKNFETNEDEKYVLKFITKNQKEFRWEDLSNGTRKIINIFLKIFYSNSVGKVLMIDEVDSGINPYMMKTFLKLILNLRLNSSLIVITHNPEILDFDFLEFGQISLLERNDDLSTEIVYLSEFKGLRKKEISIKNLYLKGRLGGVPFVKEN